MDDRTARGALVAAAQRLDALGLNLNSSGNLSVRVGDRVLVTPSGIPAGAMTPDDCVLLDGTGRPATDGRRTPTSEWRLHTTILTRRPAVGAIVHTHSVEATAASTLGDAVPAVHYVAARFGGGRLRCAPYATYGTAALAEQVAQTLGADGVACLMANHGAIALGADLDAAVALAADVEWLCAVYRRASQLGVPDVLDAAEIERVAQRFTTYGQPET